MISLVILRHISGILKRLIINSAQMKKIPFHRFSAKPAHRLSADSVFTHLCNPFLMSLPIVNTSQYQLAYALIYLTFNGFHLVMFCHFKSFLNEMDEIIRTTTERGGKRIIYDGFSYRVDRARPGD